MHHQLRHPPVTQQLATGHRLQPSDPLGHRRVRREQLADPLPRPERVRDHQVRLIGQLRLRRQRRRLDARTEILRQRRRQCQRVAGSARLRTGRPDTPRDRDTASRTTVAAIGPSSETSSSAIGLAPPDRRR